MFKINVLLVLIILGNKQPGLRSKFRKVFPFKFSKDNKTVNNKNGGKENCSNSLVASHLGASTFCTVATALPSGKMKNIMKTTQIPK